VYALVGAPQSWEQSLLAAVLSVPDSVASHGAAARLWGFSYLPERDLEITTFRAHRPEPVRGVRVHRTTVLADADVRRGDGIPRTSFERTLCDCTSALSESQLSRVLDDGLRRRVAVLARLRDCAERLDSGPGRHMSTIRSLLALRDEHYDPGGSASERRILEVLRKARLPLPRQQYEVRIAGKTYRLDYAWPEWMVLAEYYGLPFHTGASAVVYDSERLTALAASGWLPLIFTPMSTDREIVERTAAAIASRRDGRVLGA
jgi:hypothetical protein